MKTLLEIWNDLPLKSDKGDVHSYLEVYEEILAPYRHTAINVLEIGLFNGASLLLWEEYFTMAMVYGIDYDEQPHGGLADLRPMIATGKHGIYIMDATNPAEVKKYFEAINFDVIIEDAGHDIQQQLQLYDIFKNYLSEDGIYIVEDVQNIDLTRNCFKSIGGEIIDRRKLKGRYDDCLVIIR